MLTHSLLSTPLSDEFPLSRVLNYETIGGNEALQTRG